MVRIRTGAMGRNMAANLLLKSPVASFTPDGKKITEKPRFVVYDTYQPSVDAFLTTYTNGQHGREIVHASTPAGVAQLASVIVTMLPSSPEVREVYLGEGGILEGLESLSKESQEGTVLIDSTTLDYTDAIEVSDTVVGKTGAAMVDAPVSGGVVGAEAGTLAFMVGGNQESYNKALPYLEKMGQRIVHCGESGKGLVAKICNNLLLGINMVGTAEAMVLGASLGIDPKILAKVINSSTGKCWPSEINNPAPGALLPERSTPADRDYSGGFLSRLMAKDLRLALNAADASSTLLPTGGIVSQIYNRLAEREDFKDRDFSVIYEYLKIAAEGRRDGDIDTKA